MKLCPEPETKTQRLFDALQIKYIGNTSELYWFSDNLQGGNSFAIKKENDNSEYLIEYLFSFRAKNGIDNTQIFSEESTPPHTERLECGGYVPLSGGNGKVDRDLQTGTLQQR